MYWHKWWTQVHDERGGSGQLGPGVIPRYQCHGHDSHAHAGGLPRPRGRREEPPPRGSGRILPVHAHFQVDPFQLNGLNVTSFQLASGGNFFLLGVILPLTKPQLSSASYQP